jgi:hypothetical protein
MDELAQERIDLGRADRHIVEGEARVSRMRLLIENLRQNGRPTEIAEEHLSTLLGTLAEMWGHREAVYARIHILEARVRRP